MLNGGEIHEHLSITDACTFLIRAKSREVTRWYILCRAEQRRFAIAGNIAGRHGKLDGIGVDADYADDFAGRPEGFHPDAGIVQQDGFGLLVRLDYCSKKAVGAGNLLIR